MYAYLHLISFPFCMFILCMPSHKILRAASSKYILKKHAKSVIHRTSSCVAEIIQTIS